MPLNIHIEVGLNGHPLNIHGWTQEKEVEKEWEMKWKTTKENKAKGGLPPFNDVGVH